MSVIAQLTCRTIAETEAVATRLAHIVKPGDIIGLSGNLGAGKTTFARGFLRALTKAEDDVPSPTFTLVQTYDTTKGALWHCDLYRLTKPDDVHELGLEDAFSEAICLIEWPERMGQLLPARRLMLSLGFDGANTDARRIEIEGDDVWSQRLNGKLEQ